uniref:Uncharacterized protein n=1 Tax=viral metagenome TaxID=1070528 RepID=A0A6C0J5M6_9ZZZZ
MDGHSNFIIQCQNFETAEQRYIEFIKVNSNTLLPDFYKAITDHDSYYTMLSTKIVDDMKVNFPQLFNDMDQYGFLVEQTLKEQIFAGLGSRHLPMSSEIEHHVQGFIRVTKDISIFPNTVALYCSPIANPRTCQAFKSAADKIRQCISPKKVHTDFCGRHKNNGPRNMYNGRKTLNDRYEQLKTLGKGFFILEPKWLDIVLDKLFPLVSV